MTPIEVRLKCVEIADKLHIAGAVEREKKVMDSAQKILSFVTDNGALSDISPEEIVISTLSGIAGMITGITDLADTKEPDSIPAPEVLPTEEVKAEKKAKSVKTPAEDNSEA